MELEYPPTSVRAATNGMHFALLVHADGICEEPIRMPGRLSPNQVALFE